MTDSSTNSLSLSRTVLRALIKLNILVGFLIFVFFVITLVAEDFVMRALHVPTTPDNATFIKGMRAIMIIGILAAPLTHVVLSRLLAIVETVRAGDPFVILNAARLQTIAWSVLGLEVMHLIVQAIAAGISSKAMKIDISWDISVTRWLAVLMLFVLARVFDQGARMRDELEGTV
jgi:hypothetical protein